MEEFILVAEQLIVYKYSLRCCMYTFGLGILHVGVHTACVPLHWQEPSRLLHKLKNFKKDLMVCTSALMYVQILSSSFQSA